MRYEEFWSLYKKYYPHGGPSLGAGCFDCSENPLDDDEIEAGCKCGCWQCLGEELKYKESIWNLENIKWRAGKLILALQRRII